MNKFKFVFLITIFCLFSFNVNQVANGEEQKSVDYPREEYLNYRSNLIKFQPEFTVEGNRMITKKKAKEMINLSKNNVYQVINNCHACLYNAQGSQFESEQFEWFIWYEKLSEYSRFAPVKTIIAKFPKDAADSQKSYALFSYQGVWVQFFINSSFYSLKLIEDISPYPDKVITLIFFHPDIDYPLFFDYHLQGRYTSKHLYYFDDTIIAVESRIVTTDTIEKILYCRSVKDGKYLDISNNDYNKGDKLY